MSNFIIDADPYISTGVPATVDQMTEMVVDGILPADKVADLVADQQPDSIADAVAVVVADRVGKGEDVAKFEAVLADVAVSAKDVEQVVTLRAAAEEAF